MDIHKLRNDKMKSFFDLANCDGPSSAAAVEQNYMFIMELCATLAGAPCFPTHGKFKAGSAVVVSVQHDQVFWLFYAVLCILRQLSTSLLSPMACLVRGHGNEPSRT